jgi:hypothetical protein
MEMGSDGLRERLLARLPQPENAATYRKETASLLAKHEKALFWEKMPSTVLYMSALALFFASSFWGQKLDAATTHFHFLWFGAGVLYCVGAINDLRYNIYRNRVELLKEVKQVQLQILELQVSLRKDGAE